MIKVLGISSSPRRGGNSESLLDEALAGARAAGASIEKIALRDLCFKPCRGCWRCGKTGACVVKDDMRSVYRKISGADAVIVASPIYFGSICAQLKAMIDRFNWLWVRKHILKKPVSRKKACSGIFLCVAAADKKSFFENAGSIIRTFFATLDIRYSGEFFAAGFEKKGEVAKNKQALRKAYGLGASLAKGL